MEVTDVNQLMSWIESGTVSIICDSAQLEESSGDIDNTTLPSDETSNTASILNQSLGGSLVIREDDGTEKTDAINASCSEHNDVEPNEFRGINQAVKDKKLDKYHSESSQDKSSPHLQLTTGQYFIQMSDGQIIQVLGTLEQDAGDTLPEVPLGEGVGEAVPGHMEGTRDDVQILVVGNNSGEDMYLISTPDKDTEDSDLRISPATEVKSNTVLENADETTMLQPSSTIMSTLTSNEEENPLSLNEVEDDNCQENLLQDSVHNEDVKFDSKLQDAIHTERTKFESRLQSSKGTKKLNHLHAEPQMCAKNHLLSNIPAHKNHHQKTPKDKQIMPLKIPSKSLKEGTLVRTDRGDMVAYNLSSLPQLVESSGQMSKLQVIASMFGPAMKILRPVESKNEALPKSACKKFSVFNCKDCRAVLHSERSLQNHQRKYHKDWEEECFICGKKFLNMQYVRSHIQEMHSSEKSFQCRLCSYKCESMKDLLKHQKSHKEPRVCCYCKRKYFTHKLYKKHVINCREKRKFQQHKSACEPSSVPDDCLKREQDQQKPQDGDEDTRYLKRKNEDSDSLTSYENVEICDSSDASYVRKKFSKTSIDQKFMKNDAEFRFESKHYHKQARKMALEHLNQPVQRPSRTGRERTHRCYLCFKLFSTAAALESHKENYHLVRSERPVRVKTDTALDEGEEDLTDSNTKEQQITSFKNASEVVIKEEPVELSEDFENITIIVDESVHSPHVIKPFCIACKAYTNIDFRKYSKWFSQIPDDCQSELLRKFHQFFPCSFDPSSLVEPWMLCKKCVILIDRITDMEEKLSVMRRNLLSRVGGNSGTQSTVKQNTLSSESATADSQTESVTSLMKGNIKGIGKNLSDIEAYMKDTCEIMEISMPQKGPGRPKKNMKEKLTPVLVEDKYGGDSVSDIVKFITHDLVKKEKENTGPDLFVTNESDPKNEEKISLSKITVQSDGAFHNVEVKQEPVQCEHDTDNTNSNSVSWKVISFTNQSDQFQLGKSDHTDSHSISTEMILRNLEATSKINSQNENLELTKTHSFALNDSKPQIFYTSFSPEHLSDTKSHDLNAMNDDRYDVPETLDSGDPFDKDNGIQDGPESYDCVTRESSAGSDEQYERLPSAFFSTEKKQSDYQKSDMPVIKMQGKKKAEIQEERSKMCYKVDELLPKQWRCKECHKSFSTERGACDHYAASHKGENYACEQCSVSYVRKRDLIGHYNKMHLNIKPYKCKLNECPERFSSHGQLYRHMQSAHNAKKGNTKYECHVCSATFAEKRYRDAHLPVCLSKSGDSVPHKCPFCHKAFKLARYLQLHMRTVHWLKNEQFLCEICDKVLTDKKNVIIHMKSHMGETKAKCEVCGKEFNRKSYLWTHMRTHTNQRPYKCNFCSKAFNQYSTWKNHERTHTGEKPYKCYICSANFATSSSLSKHVQYSHYNIRDYECDICKKKFISKAKVEEHIKVHTGEKPFKCHICNRAFNKKNNLRNHMYVHSANKKYKCEICGEGFMRKSTIENHILERHKFEFVINSNSDNKDVDVEVSTSQFISMKGIDDVPPEESYIIVFANEDEELSDPKEMQVTVLAEDGTSKQIGMTKGDVDAPSDCCEAITSMDSNTDVLPEVNLEDPSNRSSDALTTLIANGITPSITVSEGNNAAVSQVMEIDDTTFRLVAAADTTVPIYPE